MAPVAGPPALADLERVFFLDDEDRALVGQRRGEHMRLGFALQLVTVRWLGTFLEDPLDVPGVVLEFVVGRLGVEDPSQVKRYTGRQPTPFDHQRDIRRAYGWKDFTDVEPEFAAWVAARSWTSGDGPKAIFTDGVGWLRERKVLLPGVTTLARLVAKVRDDTAKRLWGVLEGLLAVPPGSRAPDLERWRKGAAPRASGPAVIKALDQVSQIEGLELAGLGAEALVPPRRLGELARYGMRADASALRRHPGGRRPATLLATVRFLEGKSVDDALELLDLLMATELVNKAQNASNKDRVRKHPRLAKASARLAVAAGQHTERSLILDLALALAEDRRRDITRKTNNGLEAARKRGRVGGRRPVVDDDKRAAILARRQRGESIRTIAAGVKVSVGVVHKTLAGAQPDTQRGAEDNPPLTSLDPLGGERCAAAPDPARRPAHPGPGQGPPAARLRRSPLPDVGGADRQGTRGSLPDARN
jgi:hypothetical protein